LVLVKPARIARDRENGVGGHAEVRIHVCEGRVLASQDEGFGTRLGADEAVERMEIFA
jgi:hypothetical protein